MRKMGVLWAVIFAVAAAGVAPAGRVFAEVREEVELFVDVLPTLEVVIPDDTVVLNLLPQMGQTTFVSDDLVVKVSTNNPAGYQLSMQADGADLTRTAAYSANSGVDGMITPTLQTLDVLSGGYTESSFTANRWGYRVGAGNYLSFTTGASIKDNTTPVTNDEATVTFAAKVNMEQPAGVYELELDFVAVANYYMEYITFDEVENMQALTSETCARIVPESAGRLMDTRDSKYYHVAKLKDGNCWMTQNLDLDIPATGLLAADTDILVDWNASSAYPPTATATGNPPTGGNSGYDMTMSYDPGNYILKRPGSWSYQSATTNLASNTRLQKVDGWLSSYSVGNNTLTNTTDTYNDITHEYDAHYHLGNYYQFNTATAGKGATVTSSQGEVADSSICPKNWKLPLSGTSNNSRDGSFYKLLNSYGIASSSSANSLAYVSAPLFLVPGGYVDYDSYGLYCVGYYGYYWSRVSRSSSYAYHLGFRSSSVYPSDASTRYYARSVRCVVPGA